jgi:predicted metalloprotease with PDZ domain
MSCENYTEQLWIFEGFTSYYDELSLLRTGILSIEQYLTLLVPTISRMYKGRGRFKQSVAQSSFDAWTKFYQQDENAPNAIVSYYTKGIVCTVSSSNPVAW